MSAISRTPERSGTVARVDLITNYFKLSFPNGGDCPIFKYSMKFIPDVPVKNQRLKLKLFSKIRKQVVNDLGRVVYEGNSELYGMSTESEPEESYKASFRDEDYTISVKFVQAISPSDADSKVFYGIFIKSLFTKLGLSEIGRKYFDARRAHNLSDKSLSIMPGFSSALESLSDGLMVKIDIAHRVLRQESAYNVIKGIKGHCRDPYKLQWEIKKALVDSVVLTKYNKNSTYQINDVIFDMNPMSKFKYYDISKQELTEISYCEYYNKKYHITLKDETQPMLEYRDKRRKRSIYLAPEICTMTGITDRQKKDFKIMKEMASITHKSAEDRMKSVNELLDTIKQSENCQETMKAFKVQIEDEPSKVQGKLLQIGKFLMAKDGCGKRKEIEPLAREGCDRDIQHKMYEQASLNKWAILYDRSSERFIDNFCNGFRKVCGEYGFKIKAPKMIKFSQNDLEREIRKLGNVDDVDLLLYVIEGPKVNNEQYKRFKRMTFNEKQIPTQCINVSTIKKGRNIMSIYSRILMQINSKLGGAPWAVSECPLSNKPTMVMGINVWKKNYKAKHSIISLTASVNIRYNKYITICDEIGPNEDLGSKMKILVEKAIESFLKINKTEISRLIIYRDGVSESQQTQVLIYEVEPIKSALKEKNISFAFIIVNKRTQTRYYVQEGRLKGPTPGMLVDEGIVSQKNGPSKDFYLVSQIAKQGAASPTHYHILHIDEGLHKSDLMLLTYKLCFLYFHINSGIKVPAPIQYSERLGALLGDSVNAKANEKRPDENGKIYTLPGKRFLNKPGLFFI